MREPPYTGHDSLPCKRKLNSGAQIRCTTSTQGPQCCWHISMYGTRYGSLWNTLLSHKPFALWPSALYHFVLFCFCKITVGIFCISIELFLYILHTPRKKKKVKKSGQFHFHGQFFKPFELVVCGFLQWHATFTKHKCPCNRTRPLHNVLKNALQYSHLLPNFGFLKM